MKKKEESFLRRTSKTRQASNLKKGDSYLPERRKLWHLRVDDLSKKKRVTHLSERQKAKPPKGKKDD